jgi:hypothetical protein
MVNTVIVYIQGSSGNLLNRTLALDQNTIPLLPIEYANVQPNYDIDSRTRLDLYNNWDYLNWNKTETELNFWYKEGLNDFVDYELSTKHFIDRMHPLMFFNDSNAGVWSSNSWKNIIFIEWNDSSLSEIIKSAKIKRTDLTHLEQIPREIKMYRILKNNYKERCIFVEWESTKTIDAYLNTINMLCVKLNLNIEEKLIINLWNSWKCNTEKILRNETPA